MRLKCSGDLVKDHYSTHLTKDHPILERKHVLVCFIFDFIVKILVLVGCFQAQGFDEGTPLNEDQ
jgi:hypothetical protein